jgi:broad specificity phosphatase PhoE
MKISAIHFILVLLVTSYSLATPKRIFFIRHGESESNVFWHSGQVERAKEMLDPRLTERGISQATHARKLFENHEIDFVVVSPMTRALQTSSFVFGENQVRIIARPDILEGCSGEFVGSPACNGRGIDLLTEEFPHVNFDHLGSTWSGESPIESESELATRISGFKKWLQAQDFNTIAVVSHGNFLKALLDVKHPENCEVIEAYFDREGNLAIRK